MIVYGNQKTKKLSIESDGDGYDMCMTNEQIDYFSNSNRNRFDRTRKKILLKSNQLI